MTELMTEEEIAEARAILADATEIAPAPWQWYGDVKGHDVYLASVERGRVYAMDFTRWGMGAAQPRFQIRLDGKPGSGIMRDLRDFVPDAGPHRSSFVGIDHPVARLLAAAPKLIGDLLATIERLTQERDETLAEWQGAALEAEAMREERGAALELVDPPESPTSSTLSTATPCECCGRKMPVGTEVATWWDDDAGEVVAHWGVCPEGDLWMVEIEGTDWCNGDRPFKGTRGPMSFDRAHFVGRNFYRLPSVTRVRLVRVKEPSRG